MVLFGLRKKSQKCDFGSAAKQCKCCQNATSAAKGLMEVKSIDFFYEELCMATEMMGCLLFPSEYPIYKGPLPPPNRYGIRPGYRWDGVDRSNGFEKKIYAQIAAKKARETDAYKWSTEDM
jgi:hypothetical protein